MTRFLLERREAGAVCCADRRDRYVLWRRWNPAAGLCNFVMLNPSTADEAHEDAAIARCQRRAERWGFGGLVVTNLFALGATNPVDLLAAVEPVGPANDTAIVAAACEAVRFVCPRGSPSARPDRRVVAGAPWRDVLLPARDRVRTAPASALPALAQTWDTAQPPSLDFGPAQWRDRMRLPGEMRGRFVTAGDTVTTRRLIVFESWTGRGGSIST